jgi:cytochrome c oxidase assembly protein subunit 15
MAHSTQPAWLSRFAAFTAVATLGLIALGGLVTSHGAGMAVPDWPTTYGYNMFLFPVSQWVGGIFYEHTHRLWASGVGLLTVILAVGLQLRAVDRRLARLGWFAVALVVFQGLLGGLRVSLMRDQIGVFHAGLAQAFLVLVIWIAVSSSARWSRWRTTAKALPPGLATAVSVITCAIFLQLLLGATMRHQHAGLAVPDFPLAYGELWPPSDPEFLARVNSLRTDVRDFHPITAFQIHAHMAHRLTGVALLIAVCWASFRIRRAAGPRSLPGRLALGWIWAIVTQAVLGAVTVWSNKAADIATAHVVVGAMCLALGAIAAAACRAGSQESRVPAAAAALAGRTAAGSEAATRRAPSARSAACLGMGSNG